MPGEGSRQLSPEPGGLPGLGLSVQASSLVERGKVSLTDHGIAAFPAKDPSKLD